MADIPRQMIKSIASLRWMGWVITSGAVKENVEVEREVLVSSYIHSVLRLRVSNASRRRAGRIIPKHVKRACRGEVSGILGSQLFNDVFDSRSLPHLFALGPVSMYKEAEHSAITE